MRVNRMQPSGQWSVKEGAALQTLTDAQIISMSNADPDRFGEIFDRHFPTIHRYVHRRVGRELADDLSSETFAVAFRSRSRFDPSRDDAAPWLYGIAANLLRDHHRSERRRLLAYAKTGVDPILDGGFDAVDTRLDADAEGPGVARALARLSPGDRETLLLFAWADLTYGEIAEALAIPIGTVRSRLSRARRQVHEILAASGSFAQPYPDERT
ncbi:MAG: RNA polymerase sigma factor [Actinomycetota bacterium]